MDIPVPDEVWAEIKNELYAGNKIQAIKLYREATKQGLKESKDAIEKLEAELRNADPSQFKSSGAGCLSRAALFALTIATYLALR